ncbi:hypothetical protein ASPZODRAFT_128188 [Penicilliopsis zonata CBS 506.65]|uniref:DNA polymerase lambda n=1 Tax=Penicilliopsis zonata CBS 506.65 TaxID=1073090 RepID=A0A1L9SRD2_9EURO|nr:hypothetical protein ASPZODRAFT_128188 [Penicilliopsis zonata CBS 506.65]OJJ49684.1 hypothetical protein ASPZODRAFT_128188 [Penicilliopsis zonata CBS 506.65]
MEAGAKAEAEAEKALFFKELDKLDYMTDGSQDQEDEEFSRMIIASRIGECSAVSRPTSTGHLPPPTILPRAKTEPQTVISRPQSSGREGPIVIQDSFSSEIENSTVIQRSHPTRSLGNMVQVPASKRRKTAASFKTVPENLQIFKDLTFFFFPNNDISPLRRLRIQKAQEYGARWARAYDGTVTHIIVDMNLTWEDLVTYLKIKSFPVGISVVNEGYPAECITFRSVLSPYHTRFHVKGAPTSSTSDKEATPVQSTEPESLPLKPSRNKRPYLPAQSQDLDSQVATSAVVDEQVPEPHKGKGGGEISHNPVLLQKRDALDEMIEAAKLAEDLPLDPLELGDDEDPIETSGSESESPTKDPLRKQLQSKMGDESIPWQQRFTCMLKHDGSVDVDNPNHRTIEILQQMLDYYTRTADTWRTIAYRKAIGALKKQQKKIITKQQALSIPGIGERLADKIEEIVCTNRLRRLENANATPEDIVFQKFIGVYGAGVAQASKWIAQGFQSLDDLKEKAPLTKNQRIGVERYHDFAQRIPRHEVTMHGDIVRRAVTAVAPEMQVIIGGSYRRGAKDSGDIDLLITGHNATLEQIRKLMIDGVVPSLFAQGFLQASLATTSRNDGSKWHGACSLPGKDLWRRIDLLFVPGAELGAALIYFTGNDIFNRSLRLLARKKGMCLNQRGLFKDVLRGTDRVKLNAGCLCESRDEKRIFQLLDVPWRPPEHRIC